MLQSQRLKFKSHYLFLLVIFVWVQASFGAELVDIRTGFHHSYSRIVVQFTTRVQYKLSKDIKKGALILEFQPVRTFRAFNNIDVDPHDKYINRVEYQQSSQTLKVIAYLHALTVQIDSYVLNWPYRVVIDIRTAKDSTIRFQGEKVFNTTPGALESPPAKQLKPQRADSLLKLENHKHDSLLVARAMNFDSTENLIRSDPSLNKTTTDFFDKGLQLNKSVKRINDYRRPGNKFKVIVLIIAGFILLDVILIAYYFLKRHKNRRLSLHESKAQPIAKDGTRPALSQFTEILNTSLHDMANKNPSPIRQETKPDDWESLTATIKIDNMISSLSQALNPTMHTDRSYFELENIVKDIEILSATSGLSKEHLIGQDGLAFVKNMKKLSAN